MAVDEGRSLPKTFLGEPDSDYDISHFYTAATNKHDHSKNVQVPIPDYVRAEILKLVNSGQWPAYSSVQAFMRDATVHRLHWIRDQDPDPDMDRVLNAVRREARQEARRQLREAQIRLLEGLEREIDDLFNDRQWDDIEHLCDQTEADIEEVPEPWKGRTWELITDARTKVTELRAKGWRG